MAFLTRIEALKDLLQEAIDKGAHSVEQIHKTIAAMPLSALKERGLLSDDAAEKHDESVGAIYDAIRRVNKEVGDLASGLIESLEDHQAVQKNMSEKKSD